MRPVMKIYVKLYATLAASVPESISARQTGKTRTGSRLELELPEGSTVADLMARLALPQDQVIVTFVNARARNPDYRLAPGDEVGIFPPIGGGTWKRSP
jgi:molybdopterin synthase sulfur carrier subunit